MTKETLIKSALRALVNEEVKQGSAGYALEEDSAYEVSWKDVLKWLEQQPSECTEHPCLDKLCRYYKQPYKDCISREALLNSLEEPMNWTDSEAEIQEQRDYEGFVELVKSMPSVIPQIETCEDAISRQAVKDKLMESWTKYMPMELDAHLSFVLEKISELPSVTPSYNSIKTELDCISRQATVERLCKVADFMNEKREGLGSPYVMAALFIQDNKDEFPPVTPCTNLTDTSQDVLDKIRAEIELHRRKTRSIDTYDLVGDCLDIIDKYKTESEE